MKVTIRDTVTGKEAPGIGDGDRFWWAEHNGCCDCNRALSFPEVDEEMEAAQLATHPEWAESFAAGCGVCYGETRFLIVACDDPTVSLLELNEGYPPELVAAHIRP